MIMDEQLSLLYKTLKGEGECTISIAWSKESPRVRNPVLLERHIFLC